jgi:AcrR family transcriptional regulator
VTSVASTSKGERTQARVLDAAVARFGTNGFRATSVAAIAREAGVSAAAPFAYWPSKEALFEAAVDADAHGVIAELLAVIDHDDVTQLAWIAPVEPLLTILAGHPLSRRVLAGQEPEVIGRLLEIPSFQDLRAHIAQCIIDGKARGVVRDDVDPALMAQGIETITLALTMATLQLPETPGPERTAGLAEVLLASIRPPRRSAQ